MESLNNARDPLLSMGIDPGWKNLGLAVVLEKENQSGEKILGKVEVKKLETSDMSVYGYYKSCYLLLTRNMNIEGLEGKFFDFLCVERYVPYKNLFTAEGENITMTIGALIALFTQYSSFQVKMAELVLVRAIEWKMELVKLLNKYFGFSNPSMELDKKFSVAAAKWICIDPSVVANDHIADAICLAALPILRRQVKEIEAKKKTMK